MVEGRRRWVERMREAKAAGLVDRFPNGARSRHLPPLSKDPIIRKAQRIVEKLMAQQDIATGAERSWSELTMPEKLSKAADLGLDRVYEVLQLPVDAGDPKLLALVTNAALSIIGDQIKVDTAKLTATAMSPAGLTEAQKRERARAAILEAFAERPPSGVTENSE